METEYIKFIRPDGQHVHTVNYMGEGKLSEYLIINRDSGFLEGELVTTSPDSLIQNGFVLADGEHDYFKLESVCGESPYFNKEDKVIRPRAISSIKWMGK